MRTSAPALDRLEPSPRDNISYSIMLDGRCSINGGEDESCSTVALSLDDLTVMSTATVSFTDDAILLLPHVGLLKGVVSRTFKGGFDLRFDPATQGKLVQYLQRLELRGQAYHEARAYQRMVPLKKLVTLRRAGEADSMARMLDLSRSGVAFTSSKSFKVGEALKIGVYGATIVRLIGGGATAHFDDLIPADVFDVAINLDDPTPVVGRAFARSA